MTEAFVDPYVYPGTRTLINRLGIQDDEELSRAEYTLTLVRRRELERLPVDGSFDLPHLMEVHRRLFQDLFAWAGQIRTVNISKGSSDFHPFSLMNEAAHDTFGWLHSGTRLLTDPHLDDDTFVVDISELMSRVNYMHPFREGNGRTQRAFADQVASVSGRTLSWRNVGESEQRLAAIRSVNEASGRPFEQVMRRVMEPPLDGMSVLDSELYRVTSPAVVITGPDHGGTNSNAGTCGAETRDGHPCRRRGHCPFHGGA